MKKISKTFFLVLCLISSANCIATELNKENIEALLAGVDAAMLDADMDALSDLMTDDARFIVKFIIQGRYQALPYSKDRYIKALKQVMPEIEDYTVNRSDLKIDFTGDQALVTTTLDETATVNGRNITAQSEEQATVAVINGKLLITRLSGELLALSRR